MKWKRKQTREALMGDILELSNGDLIYLICQVNSTNGKQFILDTLPGSEAKVGDTVMAIEDFGDLRIGDIFVVEKIDTSGDICAPEGTKMGSGKLSIKDWNWDNRCFRVLQPATEEAIAEEPRIAIVTKKLGGFPEGSKIINKNSSWVLLSDPNGIEFSYTIGLSCEWEDEIRAKYIGTKIKVTAETRQAIQTKLKVYGLANSSGMVDAYTSEDTHVHSYYICENYTGYMPTDSENADSYFKNHEYTEIYWNQEANDFSFEPINQTGNPFKKGDIVKRIKNGTAKFKVGETRAVYMIDNEDVYYRYGFAAHYTDFELVSMYNNTETVTRELTETRTFQYAKINKSTKEDTMSKEKITIEIDANLIREANQPEEDTRTDLEKTTKSVILIFRAGGELEYCIKNATSDDVKLWKANLQKPQYLGYTIRIYKLNKGFTTAVPVVETN